MKKLLLAGVACAAFAGSATAADLARPVYRRPVVYAPVASWTGFYVGGNLGYSWGSARTDVAGSGTVFSAAFLAPGNPGIPSTSGFATSDTTRLNGIIGGGQFGYNYQFSPKWVLGFETDIQGSRERGSGTSIAAFSALICTSGSLSPGGGGTCSVETPADGAAATAYDAKIAWFGTVRGRLGFLIGDQVLLYGTGGLAYGRVELSGITGVNGLLLEGFGQRGMPGASVFSASKTNAGLAVGGGIEGKVSYWLPAGWTWKAEYLYIDLGSLDAVTSFPAAIPVIGFTSPLTGAPLPRTCISGTTSCASA